MDEIMNKQGEYGVGNLYITTGIFGVLSFEHVSTDTIFPQPS